MKFKIKNLPCWTYSFMVSGLVLMLFNSCKKTDEVLIQKSVTAVTDNDGYVYNTVTIGTQVWMVENLKTTKYNNGDPIETTSLDVSGETAPKYQWSYGDSSGNAGIYGRLYTWYAVTDSRKICPEGWHIPSDSEWETLKSYLGGENIAGGKLKEANLTHWESPNVAMTNETGFTALPGGYRDYEGNFVSLYKSSYHWSSTPNAAPHLGWGQHMSYSDGVILRGGYNKSAGVSVRCLQD